MESKVLQTKLTHHCVECEQEIKPGQKFVFRRKLVKVHWDSIIHLDTLCIKCKEKSYGRKS